MPATSSILDIVSLLQPFPGDAPAGRDPRADVSPQSAYFKLRDARAEARQAERASDLDTLDTAMPAAWNQVRAHAAAILADVGKDIEVASWLAEALVRQHGLVGLAEGAVLVTGLIRDFWSNGLFPLPDEDGLAGRIAPLAGLNGVSSDGTLMQPLRKLVLFERPDQSEVTLWRFERAEEVEGIGEAAKKKQRIASGVFPFGELEQTARTTGAVSLAAIGHDAQAALAAWRDLVDVLAEIAGQEAPPSSRVASVVDKIIRIAERYVPDRMAAPVVAEADEDAADTQETIDRAGEGPAANVAKARPTREGMLKTLAEVAQYFRTHEPHSPLAYTLDDAIRRGRLSWPELLGELVPDPDARAVILSQLGIRPTME